MTLIPFDRSVSDAPDLEKFVATGLKPSTVNTLRAKPLTELATALVYCEGNFGRVDGKTANGLVRHSEMYDVVGVIDSSTTGRDAGTVLDGKPNGIPVFKDFDGALELLKLQPSHFIYGMAPAIGKLSGKERGVLLSAVRKGMHIVNGMHEFLNDDPEFAIAARTARVSITDVRRPRAKSDLRLFSGRINDLPCLRIAVLGTDCAIGKRTTASILTHALNDRGIRSVMISTGQTGLMQGGRYGVALDAVPSQFCCGELEAVILEAYTHENPDVLIIEGQGALSHPAFCTSAFILRGSMPQSVILQHAPARRHRCDFEKMDMPCPASEISLIQSFSTSKVIGITINHENMTDDEIDDAISTYQRQLGIPVTDALARPAEMLVQLVLDAHPELAKVQAPSLQ